MKNEMLRKFLEENSPDSVIFNDPAFDNSIVGLSSEGNLVYDLQKMIEELAENDKISTDEAHEFIDYNTMRILPYIASSKKPVIVDFEFKELYN